MYLVWHCVLYLGCVRQVVVVVVVVVNYSSLVLC